MKALKFWIKDSKYSRFHEEFDLASGTIPCIFNITNEGGLLGFGLFAMVGEGNPWQGVYKLFVGYGVLANRIPVGQFFEGILIGFVLFRADCLELLRGLCENVGILGLDLKNSPLHYRYCDWVWDCLALGYVGRRSQRHGRRSLFVVGGCCMMEFFEKIFRSELCLLNAICCSF